jgi:hypothetical protein
MTIAPSCDAEKSLKHPANFPIGVRVPDTITASLIVFGLDNIRALKMFSVDRLFFYRRWSRYINSEYY